MVKNFKEEVWIPSALRVLSWRGWPWQRRGIDFGRPDPGLVRALTGEFDIPYQGQAWDCGFGTTRNLELLARYFPGRTIGFELDQFLLLSAQEVIKKKKIPAQVKYQDVLQLKPESDSLAVGIIGIAVYNSKDAVEKFLREFWDAIAPNGILHVSFVTFNDWSRTSLFNQYTNYSDPDRPGSYWHNCGYGSCQIDHPGVHGASYWDKDEVFRLLGTLGTYRRIFDQIYEWYQVLPRDEHRQPRIIHRLRSVYIVTLQKIS